MSEQAKGKTMISGAFRNGFARGFSSPFAFFDPPKIERPEQFNASVAKAWSDVGRALSEATDKQGARVDKEARSKNPGKSKRRYQAA